MRELGDLQREFNRFFEGFGMPVKAGEGPVAWNPAVDIYEDGSSYVVKAELPGMSKDDVEIQLNEKTLTLRGERKLEKEVKEDSFHLVERSYGRFLRTFMLPTAVEGDKISATFKEGVLQIVLPKAEEAKAKIIDIHAE
jgi:HSP20 family protein